MTGGVGSYSGTVKPSREEIIACKNAEEAKRDAYLKRRMSPPELWAWQQQSIDALARLRADTVARFESRKKKV